MSYLLNIIYVAILVVTFPWLLYAAIFKGKYRDGFAEKLLGRVPERTGGRPCVWLHAVSVGEVNLIATLLAEIEKRRPDVECVISTTTMTGYALAKKKYAPRTVFYAPLDFSWAVKTALRRIRPDVLVLAELELWPNLIRLAKARGAKVAVVNGRLSEKSFRGYLRIAPLVRGVLRQIDVIAAQNDEYAARFQALKGSGSGVLPVRTVSHRPDAGATVCVTGSLKFDGAQTNRQNAKTCELAALAGLAHGDMVFLAGSTQQPEEELALAAFAELKDEYPNLRLILVPRHPDRFDEVAALIERSGLSWQRRSQLGAVGRICGQHNPPGSTDADGNRATTGQPGRIVAAGQIRPTTKVPRILLVDTIGELGAWWGTARIAYVGGSMGSRGGQNMIEPAAYGAAVCFGPNTWNFRDVVLMLLSAEAAVVLRDGGEMQSFVRRCLEHPLYAEALGRRAQALVLSGRGATASTADLLQPLLPAADAAAGSLRRAG